MLDDDSVVGTDFVILSNMDLGSRMKVGRVMRLRSAPGRSCDIMWVRTTVSQVSVLFAAMHSLSGILSERISLPLPWSESTTVSSSPGKLSALPSSLLDRTPKILQVSGDIHFAQRVAEELGRGDDVVLVSVFRR